MERKYFSTVTVANRQALLKLRDFDFDLFRATVSAAAVADFRTDAASAPTLAYSIEGLLSLEEIGALVDSGYGVFVEAEASARSQALNTMEFREWLKAMGEG